MEHIIRATEDFVRTYMNKYDSSHDFKHIRRVVTLAKRIEAEERELRPELLLDSDVIILSSLLHDVNDKKYIESNLGGKNVTQEFLLSIGCSKTVAETVQMVVQHVSYSSEVANPSETRAVMAKHPELAIVQDADRLDAIGAVGIGRCFTYAAARCQVNSMENAIQHFGDKLELLKDMMKTEAGARLAAVRAERILEFKRWWLEETDGTEA